MGPQPKVPDGKPSHFPGEIAGKRASCHHATNVFSECVVHPDATQPLRRSGRNPPANEASVRPGGATLDPLRATTDAQRGLAALGTQAELRGSVPAP